MNSYLVVDAISYLDMDLLAKHLAEKGNLKNTSKGKKKARMLKWSAIVACICMVFAIGVGMLPYAIERLGIKNNEKERDFWESMKDGQRLSILDYYPYTEYSSFVKIEVSKVYNGLFAADVNQIKKFVLVEGIVIEDYYGKISKGTTVTIPILIHYRTISNGETKDQQYDEKDITSFLQTFNNMYVYLAGGMYAGKSVYSINSGKTEIINSLSSECVLSLYSILPIDEDKICINFLDEFLENSHVSYLRHDEIAGFDKLIYDGQKETEFTKNIKIMYNYFK